MHAEGGVSSMHSYYELFSANRTVYEALYDYLDQLDQ
jgi:hypothetical protein